MIRFDLKKSFWIFWILTVLSTGFLKAQEEKIGDIGDGNRSVPVHLIDMYDDEVGVVRPDDQPLMPFSTKQTCLPCHDYDSISSGWHFNAADPKINPGRPGQPWILVDPMTATQIPVSYRDWPGLYHPEEIGLTPWYFVQKFGRHIPGGGVGENGESDPPELIMRWMVSGKLEINCLSCHDGDASHDQAEYAEQVIRQNFRWAATASSGFAHVSGSARDMPDHYDVYSGGVGDHPRKIPPTVEYTEGTFNSMGKVFFNIVRKIPNERCYFCHSTKYIGKFKSERWEFQEDIHLKSGLNCVDCHRNGLDHAIIRGYEGEAQITGNRAIASFSCKGCHMLESTIPSPEAGQLGAPEPKHVGIPVIHFEKLSCTACHSGPWPSKESYGVKTSRAHVLGVQGAPKSDEAVPHIVGPVFAIQENGKLAPHKLFFPSFWVFMEGDSLIPVSLEMMRPIAYNVISQDTLTDSTNFARIRSGTWPNLTQQQVLEILKRLVSEDSTKDPGFVNRGKLYCIDESGELVTKDHPAAQPCMWAFAHDVRPASQSLGSRGCEDCHSLNSAFLFGKVTVHSLLPHEKPVTESMSSFQKLGLIYPGLFALSFFLRPWLKIFLLVCCLILLALVLRFAIIGFDSILKTIANKEW